MIQKAKSKDSEILEKLFSLLYKPKQKWSESAIKEQIETKSKDFYLIYNKNNVVGAIGIKLIQKECKIGPLIIKEKFQKQGYGSLVLKFIEKLCRENNVNKIWGHSLKLYNAEKFYEKQGYKSKLIKNCWNNLDCYYISKQLK